MKLYYMPAACSLAPHIILRETGQKFALDKLDRATRKTESGRDFASINPKGYVPALELDDGEIVTEGSVIQQYLADLAPQSKLAPARGTKERRKLEEWLTFITTEIHKGFSPLFAPTTPDEYKAIARENLAKRFAYIESVLADGRAFLLGETYSIADIYLFVVSNWGQFTGVDISRWPRLKALTERVAKRPAVQAALEAEGLRKAA